MRQEAADPFHSSASVPDTEGEAPPDSCNGRCVFRQAGHTERRSLESFVRDGFHRAYRARVTGFMPELWSLRRDGRLAAACGLRSAAAGPLFLERYLETPVEAALAASCGQAVARRRTVEVGNLAVARAGNARPLIRHLTLHLHEAGVDWAVFTAVRALRNSFLRLGIPMVTLARADPERLDPGERPDWGTYYDMDPLVTAVAVGSALDAVRKAPCSR